MRNAQIVNKINFSWNDLRVSTCCGSFGKKDYLYIKDMCWGMEACGSLPFTWVFPIYFMVYNFTQKSYLSFAQRNPSYWKMTSRAWSRNQDGFEEMEKKFPCGTFWDRQHLVASKVFLLLKQPEKMCSIWGNSQSRWILLLRKAHKIPLRKLDYSTPIFYHVFTIFDVDVLVQQNLNWVSCHVECWNSPFNINTFTLGFVHCLFQDSLCCWQC